MINFFYKIHNSPKKLFILGLMCIILSMMSIEIKNQYYEEKNFLNPYELMEKIQNEKELEYIKICNYGESIFKGMFSSDPTVKVVVKNKNGDSWYSKLDNIFYSNIFLMKADFGPEKNKLIVFPSNFEIFKSKIFTSSLNPILQLASSMSSIIFMIYIISSMKQQNLINDVSHFDSNQMNFPITFKDVAGNEEEKEEMKELIDFLKQPQKYSDMGATIPKGVLLEGPPGTGKTLLAKALAGESNCSFYAVSGSDFVEKYVGVGASRIRSLFKEIRINAPCILFIDEIDVLGGKRSNNSFGGSSEKDSTLNQFLTEMDGFKKSKGIIVVGATNRVDILDSALLRPGRFDRIFKVGLPDVKAREEILRVHSRNKKIAPEVDFKQLAKQTPYMSGAQLAAVLNEASILTVRNKKTHITTLELEEAVDRVLMGPAKKSIKYNEEEKKMIAYHEAGHAVIGLKLKHAQKVQKITIIPRGSAGGYNLMMPEKETFFSSKKRMLADIISYLGGRVAEELMFDDISDGAYDDFKQATIIAKFMVTKYGMSDLGPIQDSEFSDKKEIDHEIKKIINTCHQETKTIMKANKSLLDKIANLLLEQETITSKEIEKLFINSTQNKKNL